MSASIVRSEVDPPIAAGGRPGMFLVLGCLYAAQAIPSYLFAAALPPILRHQGVSLSSIGFIGLLMLPLLLKFLWAPYVDAVRPFAYGHRRAWILPTQLGIVLALLSLALAGPDQVGVILAAGFVMTMLSATQDIATDGYATRRLQRRDRALGNAIQAGAVAFGVIVGGSFSLFLYDHVGWTGMILAASFMSLLPLLALPFMTDDVAPPARPPGVPITSAFTSFFTRPEAVTVLLVALIYRASEGLVKSMEGPYLIDAGLRPAEVGYLSGLSAATAGIIGAAIAVVILRRLGVATTLVVLGLARTACFALFAAHAAGLLGNLWWLLSAAAFQTMLRYMEIVALYNLFMDIASRDRPGTDFTVPSCAQLIVYMIGSLIAGQLADAQGYAFLFTLSTGLSLAAAIATWHLLAGRPRDRAAS